MELSQAKRLLEECQREELRDHAFGDAEVYWMRHGKEVAFGYFGRDASVSGDGWSFGGDEAWQLRKCGKLGAVERNDETGPDTYSEGACMPSLTLEGVREELTGEVKGLAAEVGGEVFWGIMEDALNRMKNGK